ncbi:MAG TPA: site-2 protease family protein [Ktedonobacterales bacterium]|nr:site-2 protease family protein [Ktedonobacterales bacterium]
MSFDRYTGLGQSDDEEANRRNSYPIYPPAPEYFQSPTQNYPPYPPEPDYFQSPMPPAQQAAQPDYFSADYHETPTNQLSDIRYDQPKKRGKWAKAGGGAGAAILAAILKFGSFLLVGLKYFFVLFKFGPALSIIISLAVYGALFGWPFAIGIIFLLFLHEMGHVIVLRAKGVPASAPIFIPLMGAFVAMKGMPRNAKDEAEIGIAGPILGTVAALLCLAPTLSGSSSGLWPALAYFGFFINLFNLVPITPLDGGRIVGAISRKAWYVGLVFLLGLFFFDLLVGGSFNIFLALIIVFSIFSMRQQARSANQMQSYYQIPLSTKIYITLAYFGLAAFLVVMMLYARSLIPISTGY